jgi:hypothetical protein
VQLLAPLDSVTTPVGVPVPGAVTASTKLKLVDWLTRLRGGPLTLIVVAAAFTWWVSLSLLVLAANASVDGRYSAVKVLLPALVLVSSQLPPLFGATPGASVSVQLGDPGPPSRTVTVPAGEVVTAATLTVTV